MTGKIVLAHLKQYLDYYKRLEVAELEGDLLKALIAQDFPKVKKLYTELTEARRILNQAELNQLASE